MKHLTVKSEKPPVRCEICHQTDCFNPDSGICNRCAGVCQSVSLASQKSQSKKLHPFEVQFWDFFLIGTICFPWAMISSGGGSGLLGVWTLVLFFTLAAIRDALHKRLPIIGQLQPDFLEYVGLSTEIGVTYSLLSGLVSFTTYCLVRENTRFFKLRNHFDFNDLAFFGAVIIGSLVLFSLCGSLLLCSVLWKRAHKTGAI